MITAIDKKIILQKLQKLKKEQVILYLLNDSILKGRIIFFNEKIVVVEHLKNIDMRTILSTFYVKNIVVNKLWKELG